jgi:hypothetical protein
MHDFWERCEAWKKAVLFMLALGAFGTLAHQVIGLGYVWAMVVAPRVDKRCMPIERSADYLVTFIQMSSPDSLIKRVDSAYMANREWRARIRGEK